ncbi:hypothetical protein [Falsiroseomonas oryzae]|uniref:hypothetical protein n=1 Tax=Falsiroseomonas oryzae TaxID=2766473 RepID=UPI0022EB383F|nr:hypothetical protein [Roseomonas sp. MO-31]
MRWRALLLLPLLAACAVGPTLQERLSVWVGRQEGDLVAEFGVPVRTYDAEGRRFLQYEWRRTVAYSDPGWYRPYYGGPWGPRWGYVPAPPVYAVIGCDLTFVLRDGRVESFTYRGQGCA